jgi:Flp pilus assembly pilin Flp
MLSFIRLLLQETRGSAAVDYTMIVATVSVAAALSSGAIGRRLHDMLGNVASAFQ